MNQLFSNATLIYRATKDGFGASAFQSRCDNMANTVAVISNNLNLNTCVLYSTTFFLILRIGFELIIYH